jgi:hypothetical protein
MYGFLSMIYNHHQHHHKFQGLDPSIRPVSRVTTALAKVTSVSSLWSVVIRFQKDSVWWHSLQVQKPEKLRSRI